MGRPASACCGAATELLESDAALAGRRRDDPQRHLREDHCSRSRRTASRPAPPTFPARSGSARALDFIERLGRDNILEHEEALTGYGVDRLSRIPGVRLIGAGQRRLGILSFDLEGVHPHDLATVLDQHHVAVRAGHHCAQPLIEKLGYPATTRASLGVYNDESDIDALAAAIEAGREMFA